MSDTTSAPAEPGSMAKHYVGVEGHWDEARLSSGFPRRHWRKLMAAMGRMGLEELNRCWQSGQQLIRANGISYDVGDSPRGQERPWTMDPIPLVLAEKEWSSIEAAIVQRATLLNAVLSDLYGEQRLLDERHFPPALLFANPRFLRPCHGVMPRGGVSLLSYAADLARFPDGTWRVISDRTQAPSGLGYALENRLVSARALSDVFSQHRVRPLGAFFDAKRDALLRVAANQRGEPRVVMLTSGPYNKNYFEHSLLAGHWGFPLVEGADLTVRDSRVYVKTLAGLEPVDLLVRRLDDSFCDPLELRGDSLLGVPGLLQAARAGTVILDNALGSGVIETPGQMDFLPGLCRRLLDQELLMSSAATWWCGRENARRYVRTHLDQLTILPAFPQFGQQEELPASMATAEKEDLLRRIEARPEQFVAQERIAPSTAPVRVESGCVPRQFVLRVFAAWDGESYRVLPGGLVCVANEETETFRPGKPGGSKDTWVLYGQEDRPAAARAAEIATEAHPARTDLPSRCADNLFWLGRYAERVEANVRLVRTLLPALAAEEDFHHSLSVETALQLLIGLRYLPPELASASLAEQLWGVKKLFADIVYDRTRRFNLGWNLGELHRVARSLRECLSLDTWRVLQQMESIFSRHAPSNPSRR